MRRVFLIALAAAAVAALPAAPAAAGVCGLPDTTPLWIDFGAPGLADVFGRPGVIVAGSGEEYPAEMRARGAQVVFWDMYLNKRVGTPSAPASAADLDARADRLFDFAVASTRCATPVIAMNELFGASTPTPWTATTARYRANVLQWARRLQARGARPVLLVSSNPFTSGEATQWWRDVAAVADLVLEKYFAAPGVHRAGPVLGSRRLRTSLRRSAAAFLAIGVPPQRLGFMLGFQTKRGAGGREGLQPDAAWFEVSKLQALAARQVTRELGLGSVWSWGWGQFDEGGADPAKAGAACVWLWARDPRLCDAPRLVERFPADRRAGQIDLAAGVRCALGTETITTNEIGELVRLTGDAEVAFSALYARLVERRAARLPSDAVAAAERAVVASRFDGSRTPYLAALARGRASVAVARGVIADELRRRTLQARFAVPAPRLARLEELHSTYGGVLAREVAIEPAPGWLPGGRGIVLATEAPASVFAAATGGAVTVRTADGPLEVRALDETTPLAGIPFEQARPALTRAFRSAARLDAYHRWTTRRQDAALDELRCVRDRLPAVGAVELTSYLPFLSLEPMSG